MIVTPCKNVVAAVDNITVKTNIHSSKAFRKFFGREFGSNSAKKRDISASTSSTLMSELGVGNTGLGLCSREWSRRTEDVDGMMGVQSGVHRDTDCLSRATAGLEVGIGNNNMTLQKMIREYCLVKGRERWNSLFTQSDLIKLTT